MELTDAINRLERLQLLVKWTPRDDKYNGHFIDSAMTDEQHIRAWKSILHIEMTNSEHIRNRSLIREILTKSNLLHEHLRS